MSEGVKFGLDGELVALKAVMDDAGVERGALLGISSGACVAAAFASRLPHRVEALVLYGGYPAGEEVTSPEARDKLPEPDLVVGTSAGSYVASGRLVAGADFAAAVEVWLSAAPEERHQRGRDCRRRPGGDRHPHPAEAPENTLFSIWQEALEEEIDSLERAGSDVLLVQAGPEDQAAMGLDFMSAERAGEAFAAGQSRGRLLQYTVRCRR